MRDGHRQLAGILTEPWSHRKSSINPRRLDLHPQLRKRDSDEGSVTITQMQALRAAAMRHRRAQEHPSIRE